METKKKFSCDICDYDTIKHWAYERHLESLKHIKNKKDEDDIRRMNDNSLHGLHGSHLQYIIDNKDKKIEETHIKIIEEKEKRIEEKEKRIEEKDKIIEEDRKIIEEDRKRIQELERQLETYHSMFSINPKSSMSITQYVIKNYNNAPHLTIFTDYDKEKKELDKKELERYESDKKTPINKYVYAEQLINYYNNDKLVSVISNTIINEYKKADPSKQAVWTSDTSRLTYLIKQLFKDDKSNWVIDKKGVETCKYIVDPLLKFVKDDLIEYSLRPINTSKLSSIELELQSKYMQNGQKIINLIDNSTLKNNILKEITPAFYMSHNKIITIDNPLKLIELSGATGPIEIKPLEIKPPEIKPPEIKKSANKTTKVTSSTKAS